MRFPANWYAQGMYGKLGDVVLYRRFGKTLVRKAPGSYNKTPTGKQSVARTKFLEAIQFAQSVVANPLLKAQYEMDLEGHISAYSKAVSEYMRDRNASDRNADDAD